MHIYSVCNAQLLQVCKSYSAESLRGLIFVMSVNYEHMEDTEN